MASTSSTVVKHLPLHCKVEGLSSVTENGIGRKKKVVFNMDRCSSTLVRYSPLHCKVDGLRLATSAGIGRVKMANICFQCGQQQWHSGRTHASSS